MCEDKETGFFRPWDNPETSTKEDRIEASVIIEKDQLPCVKQEGDEDQRSSNFCEKASLSSGSFERRRRKKSDSSIRTTSSSSLKVKNETRNESVSLSKDFVLDCPLPSGTGSFSIPDSRGHSLFDAPHSSINYLQRMTVPMHSDPWCDPMALQPTASTTATIGLPFYCGFPSVLHCSFPQAPSFVEHAVGMLERQEAVAKQIRKLRPKKFRCEHCDVAFSNNGQLKGHIRIHTGKQFFYFCFCYWVCCYG